MFWRLEKILLGVCFEGWKRSYPDAKHWHRNTDSRPRTIWHYKGHQVSVIFDYSPGRKYTVLISLDIWMIFLYDPTEFLKQILLIMYVFLLAFDTLLPLLMLLISGIISWSIKMFHVKMSWMCFISCNLFKIRTISLLYQWNGGHFENNSPWSWV